MTSFDRHSGKQNASEPWEYWSVQDGTELQDRGCGRWTAERDATGGKENSEIPSVN